MKRMLAYSVCGLMVAFLAACSRSDREEANERAKEAREKTRAATERAGQEARKLGSEAKREVQKVNQQIGQALNGSSPAIDRSASDTKQKLDYAGHEAKVEAGQAGQKLGHAAFIAKVKTTLATEVGLSTISSVEVDATGHVVTLHGTVSSEDQKHQAEQAVSRLDGVTRVVNDLTVRP